MTTYTYDIVELPGGFAVRQVMHWSVNGPADAAAWLGADGTFWAEIHGGLERRAVFATRDAAAAAFGDRYAARRPVPPSPCFRERVNF